MRIDESIVVEQAQHLHRQIPTGVIGGFFVACCATAAFWNVVPNRALVAWLVAGLALAVARMASWWMFRGAPFTAASGRRWLRYAMTGAGLSGTIWGSGALFMFPPDRIDYHLIYVFAAMMMGVAAMFSFSVHLPTFLAFFLPSALAALAGLVAQGTLLHYEIAVAIAIFIAVALRFMREFNRVFTHAQQLRFENLQLVDELTVQKDAAESANLAKSRFLAAASHDLRQPMHALTLYLGALAGQELPAAARTVIASIRQCAQSMDTMFRALLDVSRLDAGAVQAEPVVFELAPLLERIRVEFDGPARARGLRLRVARTGRKVRSDPALLERVLRNLVANAVRYTRSGGVLVGCRVRGQAVRVAVYDTGPGIAEAERRKVFEEFYQVANTERDRRQGIGLGLAIVDRLARLLAAPVTMVSRVGRGSMFAVDLPRAEGAPVAIAIAPPAEARQAPLDGKVLVVIDDEEPVLHATRALLEQWRCRAITAASGAGALEQLATSARAPDALICDFRLRGTEDGISVIEALRAEFNREIPALLVTGDTSPERIQAAQRSGLRVLHKPFDERALRAALLEMLEPAAA